MIEVLQATGIMAIVRTTTEEHAREIGKSLIDVGINVIEFTTSCPNAFSIVQDFAKIDNAVIGVGTVMTKEHVRDARNSGARFVVSPNTDPDVIRSSIDAGLISIPGVATATDVAAAISAGANALKLFPASTYGPSHLRALSDPFPGQKWVATGGITQESVPQWVKAGAMAFGLGGPLLGGGVEDIGRRVGLFKNEISQARKVQK